MAARRSCKKPAEDGLRLHIDSPAIGSIYKILNTSGMEGKTGLEGKNILQLIPITTSSITSNSMKATVKSAGDISFQTQLSNCTAVPRIHAPPLQQVKTGQNNIASKPDPSRLAHRVANEVYTASLRNKPAPMDNPLLARSAMATNAPPKQANKLCTGVKTNSYPVTVKSPVLPSGHHLQIPAHAEVKSVPASCLPFAIQQKILAAAAASASGTQGPNVPSVIFVSPVNTVKTDSCKRLPPLCPKPQVSNSSPIIYSTSQETPLKWEVHDGPHSETQCLVPVKSSNNMASKILKTLADTKTTENSTANIMSFCPGSANETKTKISPIKDNALVMYNGKVYLLAKKGTNAMLRKSENSSSRIPMVDQPHSDPTNPGTLNILSNQIPGVVAQTKAHETPLPHPATLRGNREVQPKIVPTIRINTNGKCTIKTDYPANRGNSNVAVQDDEKNGVKTCSVQSGTQDLRKTEEVAVTLEQPCHLNDNLGKRIGILKEIKVNLERIPSDLIECCSKTTEERLTSDVATGKEDTGTAFERKVYEVRKEVPIAFQLESCKTPILEICKNTGSKQMNKKVELAQNGVKAAVMVQPEVHQKTSKANVQKDIQAANINQPVKEPFQLDDSNNKTKTRDNVENEILIIEEDSPPIYKGIDSTQNLLSQTPLLSPKILEQISSDLKLTIMKEKCMEECPLPPSRDYASTSLPNANLFLSFNSNILQPQAAVCAKKRKPVAQDRMGNVKRIKNIERNMFHSILLPANDCLPEVDQSKHEGNLKSKVHKKRKIKPLHDMSTKRNKIEACVPTADPETVLTGKLVLSQSNSQNSEVCSQAATLKSKHVNKRKQKLVAMQFPNMMEIKMGCFNNPDLTADVLTHIEQPSSCLSELLQMQPNSTERDLETANPEKSRSEKVNSVNDQEIPNRKRKASMLNKNQQIINTDENRTDFTSSISKDSVVSSANGNKVIASVNKDPEATYREFGKTEVVCAVSSDSETTNSENQKNIGVCTVNKNSETTKTCLSIISQVTLQCCKGHSQPTSEYTPNPREETHVDIVQNTELTDTNKCSDFKDNTASISKASTWHQPSSNILQVQTASSSSTIMGMESPGPSSDSLEGTSAFSVNRVGCESFPLPPLEVDETMIEERREERIRRLKDRLKEQEKALEAIRKTMRPNQ